MSSSNIKAAVPQPDRQTLGGHSGATFRFSDEDVLITVPAPHSSQNKKGRPFAKNMPDTSSSSDNVRKVINLTLLQEDDSTRNVNQFDPPFELRLHLTADEARRAGSLKVVYWDETSSSKKWIEIPDGWVVKPASGIKFSVVPNVSVSGESDLVVLLSYWPSDPAIGVW